MDQIITDLLESAKIKQGQIIDELNKASPSEEWFYDRAIVSDAVLGSILTGAKMALEELAKRNRLK